MNLESLRNILAYVDKNLRSFAKRVNYFNMSLPRIASGSGRVVYDINDQYVLKVAKNEKGIAQNEVEINISSYNDTRDIVTKVLDSDDNNTWVIVEKGKKLTERRFKEIVGFDFKLLDYALKNQFGGNHYDVPLDVFENEFYIELADLISNYKANFFDLGRLSSFGEVIRYGKPTVVAVDYGLNDEVYMSYYDRARRIYELYNNADGNDDLLSDVGGELDIKMGYSGNTPLPQSVDEREIKYMDNGSSVSVKPECRLGGGKICNKGDISNLNIKKITEDIDPKEAEDAESTVNTLITNKRDVGFTALLSKDQMVELTKNGIGILPIKNIISGTAYIIYRNKEKALKLKEFADSRGGILKDKTPEEARYIGKLLSYREDSINEYIRRKYKIHPIPLDTRNPEDYLNIDEKMENEGVGDKYLEKKFGIDQEFNDFHNKFNTKTNYENEKVVNLNGLLLVRNPKSLKNIGDYVRGVVDKNGNIYVEIEVGYIHDYILNELDQFGLIKYVDEWENKTPTEFITIQRYSSTDLFYIGESYFLFNPNHFNYKNLQQIFQNFINKAKQKNPQIKIVNEKLETDDEIIESTLNENNIMKLQDLPFKEVIRQMGGKIYSVGGAVRDEFIGKQSKDLDILITGIPMDKLEQVLSKYGRVDAVGKSFGILKFKPQGSDEDIDVAIPRTETATGGGGHKDFEVKSDHNLSIEDDLRRRDFTINAIAKDIDNNIIDPYGGREDLKNKTIKIVNPEAFSDDPLRMLRAVQFASRFGFNIEPQTMEMIQKNAQSISKIPSERIIGELDKIVTKGNPRMGAELLFKTGLFEQIFGVNTQQSTLDRRNFEGVKNISEYLFLLMQNNFQNPSDFYLQRFSTEDAKRSKIYKDLKAFEQAFLVKKDTPLENRSIAHNMYLISPQTLNSDIIPSNINIAGKELLSNKYPKTVNDLAVNGNDLMSLGLTGREIGDTQKKLLLNIYSDKLKNTREDIISFLKPNDEVLDESNKKNKIEYGCLMLYLDVPIWSKLISIIKSEDLHEKGLEKEPHVTILYGFHNEVNSNDVFKLYKENFSLKPIKIKITGISVFNNNEFDVVKFDVNSKELHDINRLMRNLPNTQTFPDYHPHITIAYVKKGTGSKYIKNFNVERILNGNELIFTWEGHKGKEGGDSLQLSDKNMINESISDYEKTKQSLMRSKSISKEMKEKILKYLTSGSSYREGGIVHGLSKPNEFRDKTPKSNGVSLGADKNGFYCYTHRAASKRYESPEKIPVSAIEFIESTG